VEHLIMKVNKCICVKGTNQEMKDQVTRTMIGTSSGRETILSASTIVSSKVIARLMVEEIMDGLNNILPSMLSIWKS